MFKGKILMRSFFVFLIMIFCFYEIVNSAKTHDTDTGWMLADIRVKIENNQTVQTLDTAGFGAHLWFNAKCIELYQKLTGDELTDQEKIYIMLGAVSADYGIIGSSRDDTYNTVLWHEPLKDDKWYYLFTEDKYQSLRCLSHFFNGLIYNEFNNRDRAQERLTNFSFSGTWKHASALEWAFNHPDNNYDLNDAFANRGTVGSFRAIGEIEHLILDMIFLIIRGMITIVIF